jgi:serine/threonine protein kinase
MSESFPRAFGPYVLVTPLGDGGMGNVCLALSSDGRACAVKRLWKSEGPRADIEERFRREGEIARRLLHPAIARTVDVGDVAGELYIAEEYVEGIDLTELSKADLSVPLAIHIVTEIARALAYIHGFEGLGLAHRDVAPGNVRLAFDGALKLLDFGLVTSPAHAGLTAPGTVLGRLPYLAPEVKKGSRGDVRADVYSAGVVLWELVARRRFAEEQERARGSGGSAMAASRFNPAVSRQVDAVIARATADDPAARHGSAADLVVALEALLSRAFDGKAELASLLGQLHDVDRLRAATTAMMEKARGLLGSSVARTPSPQPLDEVDSAAMTTERTRTATPLARGSKGPAVLLTIGASALVLAAAFFLFVQTGRRDPSAALAPRPPMTAATLPEPARAVIPPPAPPPPLEEPRLQARKAAAARSPSVSHRARSAAPILPDETPTKIAGSAPLEPVTLPAPSAATVPAATAATVLREAELRFHSKDLPAAESTARRALELGGGVRAQYFLGMVLFAERKFAAAAQAFERTLELDPGNAGAARQLELARDAARGEK